MAEPVAKKPRAECFRITCLGNKEKSKYLLDKLDNARSSFQKHLDKNFYNYELIDALVDYYLKHASDAAAENKPKQYISLDKLGCCSEQIVMSTTSSILKCIEFGRLAPFAKMVATYFAYMA